jgi:DUF4097 and DUF4098 domain-containing protein YvlB
MCRPGQATCARLKLLELCVEARAAATSRCRKSHRGDVDLRTGSGNVSVRGIQGALRAEAGSGDITAEGTQAGAWEIRTGSGNVHVRLPQNAAFDADISTSSGTLDLNVPITTTVQGRVQEGRKHIVGKAGGGGPPLSVRTGSGDIHIE